MEGEEEESEEDDYDEEDEEEEDRPKRREKKRRWVNNKKSTYQNQYCGSPLVSVKIRGFLSQCGRGPESREPNQCDPMHILVCE
jgi:hypothetical protein